MEINYKIIQIRKEILNTDQIFYKINKINKINKIMDIRKMNLKEFDEYNKRCDVIKNIILRNVKLQKLVNNL